MSKNLLSNQKSWLALQFDKTQLSTGARRDFPYLLLLTTSNVAKREEIPSLMVKTTSPPGEFSCIGTVKTPTTALGRQRRKVGQMQVFFACQLAKKMATTKKTFSLRISKITNIFLAAFERTCYPTPIPKRVAMSPPTLKGDPHPCMTLKVT